MLCFSSSALRLFLTLLNHMIVKTPVGRHYFIGEKSCNYNLNNELNLEILLLNANIKYVVGSDIFWLRRVHLAGR